MTVQPPRGFGSDPIGAYHAPDVPPPHHYLAFYRWLDTGWGADAVVHVGKHGTLEWLPGKANALSAACHPDAALGDLPFVYPFVVNDPGEGTQAKRRTHAVIVDHLVPPMTRAESTDDVARLETLLDAYAAAQAMDPGKLPALRRQVWDLLVEAEIHRDLGLGEDGQAVEDDEFDDMVLHVDGYLCALKDAQIRGGLHVLGRPPEGEALVDLVLAVTRLPQGTVPALRATVARDLGFDPATERRHEVDKIEAECRARVEALAARDWAARHRRARRVDEADHRPHRALDLRAPRPRPAGHARRDRQHARRPRRPLRPRGAERRPDPRRRPRPAHRPQLLLGRPQGPALAAVLGGRPGAGRRAGRAARGRDGRPAHHRRPGAVGHGRHAHERRRRGRGAGPAGRAAGVGRRLGAGDGPRGRSRWPSWAGPAST